MPRYLTVEAEVDVEDVLEELDDEALEKEIARRHKRAGKAESKAHPWTATGLADDLRAAFYKRDASRFEALLMVLDRGDVPIAEPIPPALRRVV